MIRFCTLLTVALLQVTLSLVRADTFSQKESCDTIYQLSYVYKIADKKNNPALFIIDSLERKSKEEGYRDIAEYEFLLARGYIASRGLMPNVAIYFIKKALSKKQIYNDDDNYRRALNLLSNEYYVLNQLDKSIQCNLLLQEKSKAAKKYKEYAMELLNYSLMQVQLKHYDKALSNVLYAQKILKKHPPRC